MPIQHSPPARQTRSQASAQVVLTPTTRTPLDGTQAVPQLRAQQDRGPCMEGAAPSRKEGRGPRRSSSFSGVVGIFPGLSRTNLKGPGEDGEEEEENSVEEEMSDGTEGVPALVGASQSTGGPTVAQSDQPVSHWSEPVTTTKNDPPLLVLRQLQAETKLGPIGHTISLWPIWLLLVLYGILAISLFPGLLLPQAISCLANSSISPTPRSLSLFLGLGVSFCFLGVSGPLSRTRPSGTPRFIRGSRA
ncbi:hypothetical protein O181_116382 [Austropuccinia psidii MF-1]|uniref:Uncharacterized protein n=1 Tax=Austropuccinia psidii MF-1 TaxID=1389203 RepID=A0A9Q3PYB7_9BASI|nr:hypothetical protein [Austropuccinia psidii MF-1]